MPLAFTPNTAVPLSSLLLGKKVKAAFARLKNMYQWAGITFRYLVSSGNKTVQNCAYWASSTEERAASSVDVNWATILCP